MSNSPSGPDLDALLKHGRWVRALAHSLMADSAAAEDVEQKTWLAAIERPPSKATNPRAWLGAVVRNFAGMHWREQKARRRREHVVGENRWDESYSGTEFMQPDCLADRMDTVRKLAGALAELNEPYGTTLYLRFFEELTIREIAKRMGVPQSTTHARIHRGLEMLRSKLTTTLGQNWRARCLVFTVPLTQAATLGGLTTVLAMTLKTKILVGAAALAIVSLITIKPWVAVNENLDGPSQAPVAMEIPVDSSNNDAEYLLANIKRAPLDSSTPPEGNDLVVNNVDLPFLVFVRDSATLEPIANAEVLYLDHASDTNNEIFVTTNKEQLDLEQKLERFGTRHTSDKAGVVHLPLPIGQVEIGARANNKFGYFQQYASAANENQVAELLLKSPLRQRVIVTDEEGLPVAGVTVACNQSMSVNASFAYPFYLTTDDHGVAEFRHLESYLVPSNTPGCTFGLLIPCADPQFEVELESTIGQEDIHFTVPATGAVHIECVDAKSQPLKDGTRVKLLLAGAIRTSIVDVTRGEQYAWTKDGVAIFPRVGINTSLVASTYSPRLRKEAMVKCQGPSRPGEVSKIQIIMPPESPVIQVQVLDSHAIPFQNTRLVGMVDFYDSMGEWQAERLFETSDTDGQVSLHVNEMVNAGLQTARLILNTKETPEGTGAVSFTILDLNLSAPLPQNEPIQAVLGESLIVAGKVVDQTGSPSAGQGLELLITDPKSARRSEGPVIYRMRVRTDQDGRFRFSGPAAHGLLSYSLRMNWRTLLPFVNGQDDLVVRTPKRMEISGRVLVDNPDWYQDLRVIVVPLENADGTGDILQSSSMENLNGRFHLTDIDLNEIQLQVCQSRGFPFLAQLTPSELTIESSLEGLHLQDWDLQGKIFRHEIHIKSAAGDSTRSTAVTLLSDFGAAAFHWRPGKPIILYAPDPTFDFEILADGYRPQNGHSNGEARVVLQSGIPIRLAVPSEVFFPKDSIWMLTITGSECGNEHRNHKMKYTMGAWSDDYLAAGMSHAGSWNISMSFFMFTHWNMVPAIARPLVNFENGSTTFTIEVKESDVDQTFTIPVTTEALEDALPATK